MKKPPNPAPTLPDYLPACRKIGRSTISSFLRVIKKALECSDKEAVAEFERAVSEGKIVQDGARGEVKIYLCISEK